MKELKFGKHILMSKKIHPLIGDSSLDSEQHFEEPENVWVDVDKLKEYGFKEDTFEGSKILVRYTYKDMFNMYTSPIKNGKVKVYPQWMVDPVTLEEIEFALYAVEHIERRFSRNEEE